MRGVACIAGLVLAGCSFQVHGIDAPNGNNAPSPPMTPSGSSPNSSMTPPTDDAGVPAPVSGDMATVHVGAPCAGNSECGNAGLFCARSFWDGQSSRWVNVPGGYCTMDCSNSSCPAGSTCATIGVGHYCLADCPPDPCRPGYKCCMTPGRQGCSVDPMCLPD